MCLLAQSSLSVKSVIISQCLFAIAETIVLTVSQSLSSYHPGDQDLNSEQIKTCPLQNYAAMAEFPNGFKLYPLLGWGLKTE